MTILLFILMAAVLFFLLGLDNKVETTHYTISTDKLSAPVTMVLITDLHSCDYGENGADLLALVQACRPDLILLGGDIIDDEIPRDQGLATIASLAALYDCYYVTGNHEFRSREVTSIKEALRQRGVTILEGDVIQAEVRGETIQIAGVDDPYAGKGTFADQLERAGIFHPDYYTLLLSHRPEKLEDYLPYSFDLIACGHAHGGQWRVPALLPQGLLAPNQGFFPRHTGGFWTVEETTFVVSRGLARESTRIPRLYNPPELVVIDLVPASEKAE